MRFIRKWFSKRNVYAMLVCLFALTPGMSAFEEDLSVMLAKTLYQMGMHETRDTMIALGSAAMNRVEDDRFPDTLREVLNQPGAFSRGGRYDERSLGVAREVLMGKRSLSKDAVYFFRQPVQIGEALPEDCRRFGQYVFSPSPGESLFSP